MLKVALSVAGSDSGAAAGIQADLKTFSALGVYGCTAITAITSQNTMKVSGVFETPPDSIKAQILAVMSDSPPDAIKIGMVYSTKTIDVVTKLLSKTKAPIVLDPIFASGTGYTLLKKDAVKHLIGKLIPLCTVVTPNKMEAERISGLRIKDREDAITAANKIRALGAQNVIIKGGHMNNNTSTDVLLEKQGKTTYIPNPRIRIKETHGSGCNFSAAITAYLAKGLGLAQACIRANEYVHNAIKDAVTIGKGLPVTNPIAPMYRRSMQYLTLAELQKAVDSLVLLPDFALLVPETATNFAYAVPDAESLDDVAAVSGRIVKANNVAVPVSRIEFGVSRHVASAVLTYMKSRPSFRSAMNIKYNDRLIRLCRSFFSVSSYDRNREPRSKARREGFSVSWGTGTALARNPSAEIIYHKGAMGKEPMIMVFGKNPNDVLDKIRKILSEYRSIL